jgi:ketosteroid isomerase-like protein
MKELGTKEDVDALRGTLESYVRFLNEGNFKEWLSLWEEDGVQLMDFVPAVEGKEEIKKVMQPIFERYSVELTLTEIQDVLAYDDYGVTRCTYSMKLTDKNGRKAPGIPDGKTLTLYRRQPDGMWKIHYDCSNANSRKREFT